MNHPWLNLAFYVVGSACTALGLVKLTALQPFSEAFTAFGAALLAAGRWDKVGVRAPRKP
jgi:hypothetical protein